MPEHDEKPEIKHEDGDLPNTLDDCVAALSQLEIGGLFVWSNGLHKIYTLTRPETGPIKRPAGAVRLFRADSALVAELLTGAASHYRYDKRAADWRLMNCPRRIAENVISRGHWPTLRHLAGIVESPTITSEGRLVDQPGYDSSGLYLTNRPAGYKTHPNPSKDDAIAAGERLHEAVATFPFKDSADHSAAVAAIITVLVRRSLPAAPMIAITAPTPGTGKSLLADVVAMIALGRQSAMLALGGDPAEDEKRIYSSLLAGDSILVADNVEAPLKGVLLCQMLTQPSVQFRPLGASAIATVPTNTTLIATGNNLTIIGDLRRRVMLIRLDARTERPERRTFKRDALEYVDKRRGQLIRDALSIPLAYRTAGEPSIEDLPVFGGFVDWDRLVRRPLIWAGFADPLLPAEELRDTDPDLEATRALFAAWQIVFHNEAATVAEALAAARKSHSRFDGDYDWEHPDLRDALRAAAGDKMDSRRLGGWLRRHRDRIIDGLQLQQDTDRHRKVARWKVTDAG